MKAAQLDIDHVQERGGLDQSTVWVRRVGAAMLYRAIYDAACHFCGRAGGYQYRLQDGESARLYITRDDREWPLSFANMCDVFDIDPGRVRNLIEHAPQSILNAHRGDWRCKHNVERRR